MKKVVMTLLIFMVNYSLVVNASELSKAEKQKIIETTSSIVDQIFEAANNKQFLRGLDYYSDDENAFFVSDGQINSLDDLKKSYAAVGSSVEDLHNDIIEWNAKVLSAELVSFTLPVKLRLKITGIPEYTGQIIWSALLQNVDGQWLVVQSHESWLDCAKVAKALTPQ
ncbi:MAG: nuclear transport factor 2 family protein [Paraglaciecola sp.]|uniref:nuclear transport factor 2 family protein n=1 Tax=Paraglaciecola sp. TaxID=1920173 RepID=UPI00329A58BB